MKRLVILFMVMLTSAAWGQTYIVTTDEITISGRTLDSSGFYVTPDSVRIVVYRDGVEEHDAWYNSADVQCAAINDMLVFTDAFADLDDDAGEGMYEVMAGFFEDDGDLYNWKTLWVQLGVTMNNIDATQTEVENLNGWNPTSDSVNVDGSALAATAGAISATTFATDAITATVIEESAIGTDELATDCITADEEESAIGTDELATDCITADELGIAAVDEIWEYDTVNVAGANAVGTVLKYAHYGVDSLQSQDDWVAQETSDITLTGTADSGSATMIALNGGVATDNYYSGQMVLVTGGPGIGQSRTILSYLGSNQVATVTRDWATAPDNTSTFKVIAGDVPGILEAGTATAGAAGSITLDASASSITDTYKDNFVMITAGVGIGQTRLIGAYDGGTKVATVTPNWTTNPTSASVYQIVPMGRVDVAGWLGQGVTLSGNNKPDVNIYEISDDANAADSATRIPAGGS
jgi:hypothetical protein